MKKISVICAKENFDKLKNDIEKWDSWDVVSDYRNVFEIVQQGEPAEIGGADVRYMPPDKILFFRKYFTYPWEKRRNIILHELGHSEILKIPNYKKFDEDLVLPIQIDSSSQPIANRAIVIFNQFNMGFSKTKCQPLEYAAEKWMRDKFKDEFAYRVKDYYAGSIASLPHLKENIKNNITQKEFIFEIVARIVLIKFFIRLRGGDNLDLENLINEYLFCIKEIIRRDVLGDNFLDYIDAIVNFSMKDTFTAFLINYKRFVEKDKREKSKTVV